ncbi:hypothetical protein [Streptomyces sp. NPDC090029]|uniref:hypothetical protein n=1 Tax=Streptomyces sp. NPDC090029 TaxID=3365924 RepID=UPI001319F02F
MLYIVVGLSLIALYLFDVISAVPYLVFAIVLGTGLLVAGVRRAAGRGRER